MPNCEVFILDEDGTEVGPNQVGELVVRGANVMQGYWKAPDLTEKVFKTNNNGNEKLLFTGDLFKKDEDGYLYFIGRKDDMIKTKGERVSPKEIENVLCSMDGILEAAVVGIDDAILGKAIKAFVVKINGSEINYRDIIKYCKENLEVFMVPKEIEIVEQLPRTINGKIDKQNLVLNYH
jgi:acyl-coenzyme A synthetase/AMP-(fatty) acid ligase